MTPRPESLDLVIGDDVDSSFILLTELTSLPLVKESANIHINENSQNTYNFEPYKLKPIR